MGGSRIPAGEGAVPLGWRLLRALCLLALSVLWIGAALGKLQRPMAFLRSVTAYQLLPQSLNYAVAVTFPGIELVCGLLLLAGFLTSLRPAGATDRLLPWVDAAGWVTAGLLSLFIVVLSVEILRGIKLDCGCFDMLGQYVPVLKSKHVNWGTVLRDGVILALVVPVLARGPRRAG